MIFAEQAVEGQLLVDDDLVRDGASVDRFERYEVGHAERIAELADKLAIRFCIALRDRLMLKRAAYFHDFGEYSMNRAYISSPRELTEAERLDLYRHPVIGEQQASKREFPRAVQLLVRWHHEWWNGSGYPDKISGNGIPLGARILRACDTYSALTSDRPFRKAFSYEEADRYLLESAGIEFDPEVAAALLALPERIQANAVEGSREAEDTQ
ncbi:MAG: HD domain-containing protein [Acidobacteria bacterium]|nr:MAG: HD domain-containing protein [Acidobacteriota bacterium]REK02408.1 MAG: HD domain-containing protein [Acidobacteriota bacterium]REK13790.1 MAG: HD domain-containing protein [Acidobacteriota bacterium]REK41784.1 MAG: HD domain-containing protein [Acidobacteriota bacterium]